MRAPEIQFLSSGRYFQGALVLSRGRALHPARMKAKAKALAAYRLCLLQVSRRRKICPGASRGEVIGDHSFFHREMQVQRVLQQPQGETRASAADV